MNFKIGFSIIALILYISSSLLSQDNVQTISITGSSSLNLSPNEIIIKLSYQEYFTDKEETIDSKVTIEEIEKKVLKSLKSIGVKDDKITMGEVAIIHPQRRGSVVYKKRRINKTLYVCIYDTDEMIDMARQFETDGLTEDILMTFSISQYRHTERDEYLKATRADAFADAREKASLILGESGRSVGKVISIKEINKNQSNSNNSFYSFDNQPAESVSGFRPITLSYNLEVVFEIE